MTDRTPEPDSTTTEAEAEEPGRAAVRAHLLDRLDQAGLVRPRNLKVADFDRMRAKLVDWLAYMDPEVLDTLAETVLTMAGARTPPEWLPEATIRHMAANLQVPPPDQFDIIRSWLGSIEGPVALEGGFLTELYRHLVRRPLPPPSRAVDYPRLRDEAAENRGQRARLRAAAEDGRCGDSDRAWLAAYARDEARALALVEAGARRREARRPGEDEPMFHSRRTA